MGTDPVSISGMITIAVLAGGHARRFGADKRAAVVGGTPLLRRALTAVAHLGEVLIVTAPDNPVPQWLTDPRAQSVTDRRPGLGPLAGIEAGLQAATTDRVLVVAGDHPWLAPDVLAALADRAGTRGDADAVVLADKQGPNPLLAVYRRQTVLPVVTRLLDAGERRARALLDHVAVESLDAAELRALDPDGRTLMDVDTPADLER